MLHSTNNHRDRWLREQGGGESLDCEGFVLVIGKHMFLIIVFWYAVLSLSHSCIPSLPLPHQHIFIPEKESYTKEDFLNVYFDERGKECWLKTWKKISD